MSASHPGCSGRINTTLFYRMVNTLSMFHSAAMLRIDSDGLQFCNAHEVHTGYLEGRLPGTAFQKYSAQKPGQHVELDAQYLRQFLQTISADTVEFELSPDSKQLHLYADGLHCRLGLIDVGAQLNPIAEPSSQAVFSFAAREIYTLKALPTLMNPVAVEFRFVPETESFELLAFDKSDRLLKRITPQTVDVSPSTTVSAKYSCNLLVNIITPMLANCQLQFEFGDRGPLTLSYPLQPGIGSVTAYLAPRVGS